ncbi:MAG TPA: hypothetical protein VGZ02_17580 [Candidatus Baltobacteraceae bacterium]|nr:hypothetical protein [Candidatus Baltobacteraceae bacterium]
MLYLTRSVAVFKGALNLPAKNQAVARQSTLGALRARERCLSLPRRNIFVRGFCPPVNEQPLTGQLGSATIAFLTITPEEFESAQRVLGTGERIHQMYFATKKSANKQYDLILRQASDRTNVPASRATTQIIEDWRPQFIFLIGTAGGALDGGNIGREKTNLGDVIVGDFIDYTEFRKLKEGKNLPRKVAHDHPSVYLREQFVAPLRRRNEWHEWIGVPRPDKTDKKPAVVLGNIAAGEKVLSDWDSDYQKEMLELYDKAVVFETESFGVAYQVFAARGSVHYNPQFLTIRGISDFVDAKEADRDRQGWTPYAASAAVAFGRFIAEDLLAVVSSKTTHGGG